MNWLYFAAEEGPHISLKAETLFRLGPVGVTNSLVYGLFLAIFIVWLSVYLRPKISYKPTRGLVQFFELGMQFMMTMLEGVFGNHKKAVKYAPVFGTFFIFIVLSNLSGLVPIVGEGITYNDIPVFRPFTADLNGTVALSVIAIIFVQYYSIKESGFLGHLQHYFTDKPFNPINTFVGLLEVFGEFTRVVSLSLRLFLNTAVGEILIAVFAFVGQSAASFTLLPIILFEILVALIQAYVFTVLSATYLALAISHGDHGHDTEAAHQSHSLSPAPARSD